MAILAARWLLFGSAFLSAKLLPGSSEVVLLCLLASGTGQPALQGPIMVSNKGCHKHPRTGLVRPQWHLVAVAVVGADHR